MGLEFFVGLLSIPEDALRLRQGKIRIQKLGEYTLKESDLIEAAKILITNNDVHNFSSQSDVIERAISYGWMPRVQKLPSILENKSLIENEENLANRKKRISMLSKFLQTVKHIKISSAAKWFVLGIVSYFLLLILFDGARRHSWLGMFYMDQSKYQNAVVEYKTSLKYRPIRGVYAGLYMSYWRMGDLTNAEKYLNEGLKEFPDYNLLNKAAGYFYCFDIQAIKRNHELGLSYLKKAKELYDSESKKVEIEEAISRCHG
jgi:tetratricopeptide (TPR) repeat protein